MDSSEDLSQWEEVQSPFTPTQPPNTHNPQTNSPPLSSSSSSPTPPPESPLLPAPATPSTSSSSTNLTEEARRRGSIAARLRVLSAEARRVASKALVAGKFWSIASAVAALLIGLLYRRWRRRALGGTRDRPNERLALLLREKDEKIGQLMIRIAEMNEALSAQRRVPVIRVG